LDFQHVEEIAAAVSDERPTVIRLDIGDGWVMKREYEEVYIGPTVPESVSFSYLVGESMKEVTIEESGERFMLERLEGSIPSESANRSVACFDEGQIHFPLQIRSRLPGDFMHPFGLNGTKKVQDMLQSLLVDGDGRVLWIPGMRRSRHAQVTGDTSTTLRITFISAEN
jgi:tRNA(Ile)-lysidine synthase